MSSCRWKLKLDQYPRFRTRGLGVRRFGFILSTRSWIESINARPIRTSLIITMRSPDVAHLFLRKNFSAAAIVSVRAAGEIDAGGKRSPIKRELPQTSSLG